MPANAIVGLDPGELFVHRNLGNVVPHADMNCLAAMGPNAPQNRVVEDVDLTVLMEVASSPSGTASTPSSATARRKRSSPAPVLRR